MSVKMLRLHKNLYDATYQDKREILEMLAIKVTTAPEIIDVHGIIPWKLHPRRHQTTRGEHSPLNEHRDVCVFIVTYAAD
ncbi:hypothetical protein ACFLXD_07090 [Chloroflexota bacterium]